MGQKVTREYVIAREVETKAGEPFRLVALQDDLQRLENLGLFAETKVVAAADGEGVALTFSFREMPALLPFPSFLYTEENGFSYGAALSAMNLTGRGISLSARAYFGGTTQPWGRALNGKNQLLTTAEYNFTLLDLARRDVFKWSFSVGLQVAVFADAGIAWSESTDFGWKRFRGGLGSGLRLLVPGAEQVRFDLGWSPWEGFQFHFASGTKPAAQRQRLR